jgi:acyl carrier protein
MENRKEFLTKFREIFDEANPEEINFETRFKDIDEWGSLMVLSLIVLFDEEFKQEILPSEIENAVLVEDLYNILK